MMPIPTPLADALRFTGLGRIGEATARIQAALADGAAPFAGAMPAAPIDLVAQRVPGGAAPASHTAGDDRAGGRFEARRHAGAAGQLDYMLYRPVSAAAGMPLVVMLHGCTQSPEDFARGTAMNALADERGFLVAYPRQSQAANAQKCWNWFRPGDQGRDRGEPALIAGMTRDVVTAHAADGARVFVAGLSAGGAAAAILAAAYPDLYAAVGIHSGLACGVARDLPSALMAMKRGGVAKPGSAGAGAGGGAGGGFVPLITVHGDRDATVNEANARGIVDAALLAAGVPLTCETETGTQGGRVYTRDRHRDAAGRLLIEQWTVAGAGHAWSGGDPAGSYTDAAGPDASRAMLRFFLDRGA